MEIRGEESFFPFILRKFLRKKREDSREQRVEQRRAEKQTSVIVRSNDSRSVN